MHSLRGYANSASFKNISGSKMVFPVDQNIIKGVDFCIWVTQHAIRKLFNFKKNTTIVVHFNV